MCYAFDFYKVFLIGYASKQVIKHKKVQDQGKKNSIFKQHV